MKYSVDLQSERLKELLHYDPQTGIFTNLTKRSNRIKIGGQAGTTRTTGYRTIYLDAKPYHEHRLAWLYIYGTWPVNVIDHIDRNPSNNCISNLQDVTQAQNSQRVGIHKDNLSGYLGVTYSKSSKKFIAQIHVNGKNKHLGSFDTALKASEAYQTAKLIYHYKESPCDIQ